MVAWRGRKEVSPGRVAGAGVGLPSILCCESGDAGVAEHGLGYAEAGVDPALAAPGVSLQRHERAPYHVVTSGVLNDMTSEQRRTALNR